MFRQKVANVGAAHNLYTLLPEEVAGTTSIEPRAIDQLWTWPERTTRSAIDALGSSREPLVPVDLWAFGLVPMVAQFFARGIDFAGRFKERFETLRDLELLPDDPEVERGIESRNNTNRARALEYRIMLGSVTRAEWRIHHAPPGTAFITSDVARTAVIGSDGEPYGNVVPLRKDFVLVLTRGPEHAGRLHSMDDVSWLAGPIRHSDLTETEMDRMNHAIAACARDEVYGSSHELVRRYCPTSSPAPLALSEPLWLPGDGTPLAYLEWIAHTYDDLLDAIRLGPRKFLESRTQVPESTDDD